MIPEQKIKEFRQVIESTARPLIFFDNDPDGLCSFLQFYKLNNESKGVIFKAAGSLNSNFLRKVDEVKPDNIFILDIAKVDQSFLDGAKNVYWLDHHAVSKLKNVNYYNPMLYSNGKDNSPISYWSYQIAKRSLWLAMVGCVSDWYLPKDLVKEYANEYPDLFPKKITKPDKALFSTKTGILARVFSFALKGSTKNAMTCVKILSRIQSPYEILNQESSKGKYIWKKYQKIDALYQELKKSVKITKDKLILYLYSDDKMSLTSDLSNEILYENPNKFIVIAREKDGEYKISLRSAKYEVLRILKNALIDINGFGGGHKYACGANVNKNDFDRFLNNIKKQL